MSKWPKYTLAKKEIVGVRCVYPEVASFGLVLCGNVDKHGILIYAYISTYL